MTLAPKLLPATLLLVAALAACLGDSRATDYHAAATEGWSSIGFAYDGQTTFVFGGRILIHANDRDNTGSAVAVGTLGGQEWHIAFDRFAEAPGKSFQDGGIAADLVEHGDTGIADTSIPRVRVAMAAWGTANVTVGGTPLPDPVTSDPRWVAHYMVILTGVRDDATRAILNGSRAAPYDPMRPGDGYAQDGDHEVHLVLRSHAVPDQNQTATTPARGMFGNTPHQAAYPLHDNRYVGSVANFTLSVTSTAAVSTPTDPVTYKVKSPRGDIVWQGADGMVRGTAPFQVDLLETGTYALEVAGHVVGDVAYELTGVVRPPAGLVLNFWWEDVLLGADAEAFEATLDDAHAH